MVAELPLSSVLGGDFELQNLNFDEKSEKEEAQCSLKNKPTQEDEALHQEGTGESELLFNVEAENMYLTENVADHQPEDPQDEEDFQGVSSLVNTDRTPEEDCGSSDGGTDPDGPVSQEDEDNDDDDNKIGTTKTPGNLLMSESCDYEFDSGHRADEMFSEKTPLVPEDAELPQGRDEEEDEGEGHDYTWRYERFPDCGDEMMTKSLEDEQKVEENVCECENIKVEPKVGPPAQCFEEVESPYGGASACLEFPSMSSQSLQDLIGEGNVEKMKEFSGEEHEEAGESFADYPSDFSSCEYVGDGYKIQGSRPPTSSCDSKDDTNNDTEGAVEDAVPMGPEEGTDEQEDGYLYSRDLEMDAERMVSFIVAAGDKDEKDTEIGEDVLDDVTARQWEDKSETVETLSKHPSEDEVQDQGERDNELLDNVDLKDLQDKEQPEDTWPNSANMADCGEGADWDYVLSKTSSFLSDQLITEDTVEAEVSPSDLNQSAAGDSDSYSVEQREHRGNKTPAYQGSVDVSFFFNRDVEITELERMEDDDQDDEKSWEQEQERINALFEFYNNSEVQTEGEGEWWREWV